MAVFHYCKRPVGLPREAAVEYILRWDGQSAIIPTAPEFSSTSSQLQTDPLAATRRGP